MPSAESENALQRPSAERPPCRENSTNVCGVDMIVTPPASAIDDSPERNDCAAQCNATSDEEQAVSTVTAGPCSPKV